MQPFSNIMNLFQCVVDGQSTGLCLRSVRAGVGIISYSLTEQNNFIDDTLIYNGGAFSFIHSTVVTTPFLSTVIFSNDLSGFRGVPPMTGLLTILRPLRSYPKPLVPLSPAPEPCPG